MFDIKSFGIGSLVGAAIAATATYLISKVEFEKKLDEEKHAYIMQRIEIERKRRKAAAEADSDDSKRADDIAEDSENNEEDDEKRTEVASSYGTVLETYEAAVSKYDLVEDEEGPDIDDDAPGYRPLMTDNEIRDAIEMLEEDEYSMAEVASIYGVTTVSLELLIDNYRRTGTGEEGGPPRKTGPMKYASPHVISQTQWEEERLEYEKVDLIFYRGDDVILFEETGEQMLEVGMCLGRSSNLYNSREENGRIYIRNDTYKKDYRIECREEASDGEY